MGLADFNPYQQYPISLRIEEMRADFRSQLGQTSVAGYHKRLKQFRAITARRRKLWKDLAAVHHHIAIAGFLRGNPDASERMISALVEDQGYSFLKDLDEREVARDLDIEFLINSTGDYRERLITKVVVVPFLELLDELKVVPSRKLPRKEMFKALFDFLGIDTKFRPTDASIANIVRRRKGSSAR
jgi:hypothetical protein